MTITSTERAGAGLSLLFAAGERPDVAGVTAVLEACQTYACVTRGEAASGVMEIVAGGLTFDMDGLAPARSEAVEPPSSCHGFGDQPDFASLHRVRLYPGHHLSGGMALAPVVRTLAALAAEMAEALPVEAVVWHPADVATETRVFSHSVLAWLAGGAFPTRSLTALSAQADGSVASRGLAHFSGQEVMVSAGRQSAPEDVLKVAAQVVARFAQAGPIDAITQLQIQDATFCAEPVQRGKRVLVWPEG